MDELSETRGVPWTDSSHESDPTVPHRARTDGGTLERRSVTTGMKERAMDEAPVGITISDPTLADNPLVYVNEAYERITGYTTAEALGRNCRYLQGEATGDEAVATMRAAIEAERPVSVELINYRKDGEPFWNRVEITPLRDEAGDLTHFVGFQTDVTDRKRAEAAAERRAEVVAEQRANLEHLLDRIDGLVGAVSRVLFEADGRAAIERGVCEQLTGPAAYTRAWIGRLHLDGRELAPAAWSGEGEPPAESIALDDGPLARAIEENETRVVDVTDGARPALRAIAGDASAVAAVPLATRETLYGAVIVCADRADAFGEHEIAVQTALGRMIATAIAAIEHKRVLTADSVIRVELAVADPALFFVGVSAAAGCRLAYSGSTYRSDDRLCMLFDAEGATPDRIETAAAADPGIAACTRIAGDDDGGLFEFEVAGEAIVSILADSGALTRAITAEGGDARLELELSREADARGLVERLEDRYDGVELLAYRERDRPAKTDREFVAALADDLTDRQQTALRNAYLGGFFDPSRSVSGDELAASMDVSRSTFHQHLRAAERKVFAELFDDDALL
ncbi:MAG: bacterio-opsin activator [Halobacteriales archaeon SW_9_67_24]|nr:MAG: bacterio-opsin activator [Halobacteriales archaeon SW_9_67_24]